MQSSEKGLAGNLISATDLEAILTDYLKTIEVEQARTVARLFINQLRTRNFILCFLGADSYGFVHRTFLEYFCAWEFVWQFKETQTLTIEQLINQVFGKHWQDESWHEVLRLICGMIEPKFVAEIIDFLLAQKIDRNNFIETDNWLEKGKLKKEALGNILLAANCFTEVRNRNLIATTSAQLLKVLKDEIKQGSQPSFSRELTQALISLIAINWKEDPDTLPWLKNRALQDENEDVRQAAVTAITENWKEDPDTLPFLKDCALHDENEGVRERAIIEITENWKEDPDTLPFLKDCALHDENQEVRERAVSAIAQGWKEDPDTLPWLKNCALHDENEYVLYSAVIEIAHFWEEDPDTLPWLKDRALQDEHSSVRETAVAAIIHYGQKDSELFEFLENITLNDPFEREDDWEVNPRQTALEALLENFSDTPKTLEILNQVALNDSDEELREFAQKKLRETGL
jgi:predicted NACHT family NTPase